MNRDPRFWMWGYVLDTVPGSAFFVDGETQCSLETAAEYLGCGSVFWINSLHDIDALNDEQASRLTQFNVACGLTHVETNGPGKGGWKVLYKESAAKVSELSLRYPNITGAIIDDFRSPTGPSRYLTAQDVKEIKAALVSKNPNLKLYIVQYHTIQKPQDATDCLEYIDGLTIWDWVSSTYFWESLYCDQIREFKEAYPDKIRIQGQFLHDYGNTGGAISLAQEKLQCQRIAQKMDSKEVDGWCVIQSGWLCREDHRCQVEFLKNYWNWYRGTRTQR
ncbi:MAG: hypothetical protein J6866_06235 [Victivallales bacterium]|nr:hypothetical protein [Victivallales bacterium]